jgi:hypothetical protein
MRHRRLAGLRALAGPGRDQQGCFGELDSPPWQAPDHVSILASVKLFVNQKMVAENSYFAPAGWRRAQGGIPAGFISGGHALP